MVRTLEETVGSIYCTWMMVEMFVAIRRVGRVSGTFHDGQKVMTRLLDPVKRDQHIVFLFRFAFFCRFYIGKIWQKVLTRLLDPVKSDQHIAFLFKFVFSVCCV